MDLCYCAQKSHIKCSALTKKTNSIRVNLQAVVVVFSVYPRHTNQQGQLISHSTTRPLGQFQTPFLITGSPSAFWCLYPKCLWSLDFSHLLFVHLATFCYVSWKPKIYSPLKAFLCFIVPSVLNSLSPALCRVDSFSSFESRFECHSLKQSVPDPKQDPQPHSQITQFYFL